MFDFLLPTLYESINPARIVKPRKAVGTASTIPFDHEPALEPELYYQIDDGTGLPDVIKLVKGGLGILFYF